MTPPRAPSGTQYELSSGDVEATVVEVGGALRRCSIGGVEVLDGYDVGKRCTGARGQTLVPWPNRVRDGRYDFAGSTYQLPLSEPAKRNAIHGLLRWTPCHGVRHDVDAVTMRQFLPPQAGYPFALDIAIEYAVSPSGLTVTTTATNVGDGPAPYGAGAHPYLRLAYDTIDPLTVQAPGSSWLPTDDRGIPDGRVLSVEGTACDFRAPRPLAGVELDTGFVDLERDGEGRAWVTLTGPNGDAVSLWLGPEYPYLMLFTGDTLADVAHRRTGLGIEPMTCAPNALQSGDGLVVLSPGEAHTASWGISRPR